MLSSVRQFQQKCFRMQRCVARYSSTIEQVRSVLVLEVCVLKCSAVY